MLQNKMYGVADKYIRLKEYPFSSEHKIMAVKCAIKGGSVNDEVFFVKGAIEKVLKQCTKFKTDRSVLPLDLKKEQEFLAQAYDLGRQGLRGKSCEPDSKKLVL